MLSIPKAQRVREKFDQRIAGETWQYSQKFGTGLKFDTQSRSVARTLRDGSKFAPSDTKSLNDSLYDPYQKSVSASQKPHHPHMLIGQGSSLANQGHRQKDITDNYISQFAKIHHDSKL